MVTVSFGEVSASDYWVAVVLDSAGEGEGGGFPAPGVDACGVNRPVVEEDHYVGFGGHRVLMVLWVRWTSRGE